MTEISEFQRANLEKLAAYLEGLPDDYDHFDMGCYHSQSAGLTKEVASCGAVACAVGHGLAAGIPSMPEDWDWGRYSHRAFTPAGGFWIWCFSYDWEHVDNTPHGAAKRIRWLLEKGLPENWQDQMNGRAPLCYKENA